MLRLNLSDRGELHTRTRAESLLADEAFLRAMHHILLDVHVMRAELVCPESGQVFPVEDGIPDMT